MSSMHMNRSPFTGKVQEALLKHLTETGSAVSSVVTIYKQCIHDIWFDMKLSKESMMSTSGESSSVEIRSSRRSKAVVHVEDTQNIAVDAADVLNIIEDDWSTAPHVVS